MNHIRKENGLTIIELMIVIVIIVISISLSLSTYKMLSARAKANEAVSLLSMMRTAQISYKAVNGVYLALKANPPEIPSDDQPWGTPSGNWNKLGIEILRNVRYQYVGSAGSTSNIATSFKLIAQSDLDGKGTPYDTWTLMNDKLVAHTNRYK